jgi:hypothetical protein
VRAYLPDGFVTDASVDYTTEIQSAHDAAVAAGKPLLITGGNYLFTTLSISSGAKIVGLMDGSGLTSSTDSAITLSSKTNILFYGLTFDGVDGADKFFAIGNSTEKIDIRYNRFINHNIAIYCSSSIANRAKNIIVENNTFDECGAALYVYVGSEWIINNNVIYSTGASTPLERGITLHGMQHSSVSGNHIYGDNSNTLTGILFLYNQGTNAYFNSSYNTVSNNVIRGITEESLSFDQSNGIFRDGGTASAGGNTTLTDSTKTWTTNAQANYYLAIVAGTGAGQYKLISSNTNNVLTVVNAWGTNPDNTSIYIITPAFVANTIVGNTINTGKRNGIVLYGPCFSNIISGNTLSDLASDTSSTDVLSSIMVWGVHRGGTGSPANDRQPALNNIIIGNTIRSATATDGAAADRPGISLKAHDAPGTATINWQLSGNVVANNTIGDYVSQGIWLDRVTKSVVTGNVINATRGIKLTGNDETDNSIYGNIAPNAASHYIINVTAFPATTFGNRTNADVTNLTPFYIGEEALQDGGNWYKATGLTSSDWVALN